MVDVLVAWSEDYLDISVADNGIGFEVTSDQKDEHFGLEIMKERISYVNGTLLIDSSLKISTVAFNFHACTTQERDFDMSEHDVIPQKILIVDDHILFLEGLTSLFQTTPDFIVVDKALLV